MARKRLTATTLESWTDFADGLEAGVDVGPGFEGGGGKALAGHVSDLRWWKQWRRWRRRRGRCGRRR